MFGDMTNSFSPEVRAVWWAYLGSLGLLNLLWEVGQLPLYTVWREASPARLFFIVVHCTIGDILIAASVLAIAILLTGRHWPKPGVRLRIAMLTIFGGLAYTLYSEWFNVTIRKAWTYSTAMPILPPLGTGLSPLLQWLLLPLLGFCFAYRQSPVCRKLESSS